MKIDHILFVLGFCDIEPASHETLPSNYLLEQLGERAVVESINQEP